MLNILTTHTKIIIKDTKTYLEVMTMSIILIVVIAS